MRTLSYVLSKAIMRDALNFTRFGPYAPKFAETIWINPFMVGGVISKKFTGAIGFSLWDSARVVDHWPTSISIKDVLPIKACFDRFQHETSWTATGIHEFNANNHATVTSVSAANVSGDVMLNRNKYDKLDILFDHIKTNGRLKTRHELKRYDQFKRPNDPPFFRELGGVLVHVGPRGELYFGGKGCNRLAISIILEIQLIPACLGCLHVSALPLLKDLRKFDSCRLSD